MVPLGAVVLVILATTTSLTWAGPDYILNAPNQIRPGLDYQVSLYYADARGAAQVEVKITESGGTVASQTKTHNSGTFELYNLAIPDNIEKTKTYCLEVTGSQGSTVLFQNSTCGTSFQLSVSMKTSIIFIQTDKGIYKPGSTIKFRCMSVTQDLLPNMETFDVSISDPKGNKVKAWYGQNLTADAPVFSGEYSLAANNIAEGDWKIEVETELETKDVTVKVERYVLPRFDVKINLPSIILFSDGQVDGNVVSKYSYGKDVKGTVEIKLGHSKSQITVLKPIDGMVTFNIPVSVTQLSSWGCYPQSGPSCELDLSAEVTEELSGTSQKEVIKVQLYKHREKVTFNNPSTLLKPGLTYKGTVSVTQQDDSPLVAVDGELIMEARYNLQEPCERCYTTRRGGGKTTEVCYNTTCSSNDVIAMNYTIPPNVGVVTYEFDVPGNATAATIYAQYMDTRRVSHYVSSRFQSGSGASLELKSLTNSPKVGLDMAFRLRPSVAASTAKVLVSAKGRVVYAAVVPLSGTGATDFTIAATAEMAPMCSVVAFIIHNLEVIADHVDIRVSGIFTNEVSNSFSVGQLDAGKDLQLIVSAEPNSFVYVLAIDKTVLQLAEANDITEEMVEDELGAFGTTSGTGPVPIPPCCRGPGGPVERRKKRSSFLPFPSFLGNSHTVLTKPGLIYLTDYNVLRAQEWIQRPEFIEDGDLMMFKGPVEIRDPKTAPGSATAGETSSVAVRTNFPETWLWTDDVIGPSGQVVMDVTLPDTITTWIATSFAIHRTAGLGIADTAAEVIGFREFFLYPNLPPSLKVGETFDLDVSIFNYLASGETVQATVILALSPDWYNIVGVGNQQIVTVPNNGAVAAKFKLTPIKPGSMPISISALSTAGASDAVIRNIWVFPEGLQVTGSKNYLMKVTPVNSVSEAHTIDMPALIVADSKFVRVTVTGNVMGPTIEGLESLVRRPVGCGEQNIITLVPNIYVRDLLESTGKITPEIKERTTMHMEHGVQREMTFQRTDGSFSAFLPRGNDPKDKGSTWLTAFVMQSFLEARTYVTIDQPTLEKGMGFILQNQQPDGLFTELGRVIHTAMQGGTAGGLTKTMAAYMLITMLMARDHVALNLDSAIVKTQTLLEREVTAATEDPYLIAIAAYALQLAGSTHANTLVGKLNSIAINGGDGRHWEVPQPTGPPETKRRYHRSSGPSSVEMTSYVLKTYVLRNEIMDGANVMKWLAEQRNSKGGFHSTQDTVLALGAMTAFYKVTYNTANLNVIVDVTIDGSTQRMTVTELNAEEVHVYEMDNPASNDVSITASGQGDIFVQISWSYYVPETVDIIDIIHDVIPFPLPGRRKRATEPGAVDMQLCLTLIESVQDMAVCEIEHLSGYTVSMGQTDTYVDATEITTKTVFYFRELPANYTSCSRFQFIKEINIEELKPANSKCYFYYQTGSEAAKRYTLDGKPPGGMPLVDPTQTPSGTTPGSASTASVRFPIRFAVINLFIPFLAAGYLLGDTV